jgi:hypothetical protein
VEKSAQNAKNRFLSWQSFFKIGVKHKEFYEKTAQFLQETPDSTTL